MPNIDSCRTPWPSARVTGTDGAPFPVATPAVAMQKELGLDSTVRMALAEGPSAWFTLDSERTLPMEPALLEQLCAESRTAELRSALPSELEYSVDVLFAPEDSSQDGVSDPVARRPAPRYARGLQQLALILGPCLGLIVGAGAGVAWQLGLYAPWSRHRVAYAPLPAAQPAEHMTLPAVTQPFTLPESSEADERSSSAAPFAEDALLADTPAPR